MGYTVTNQSTTKSKYTLFKPDNLISFKVYEHITWAHHYGHTVLTCFVIYNCLFIHFIIILIYILQTVRFLCWEYKCIFWRYSRGGALTIRAIRVSASGIPVWTPYQYQYFDTPKIPKSQLFSPMNTNKYQKLQIIDPINTKNTFGVNMHIFIRIQFFNMFKNIIVPRLNLIDLLIQISYSGCWVRIGQLFHHIDDKIWKHTGWHKKREPKEKCNNFFIISLNS